MKLEVSAEIPHPREKVFEVYRDKLTELVPFLPNVQSITVVTRREDGPTLYLLNRWHGGGDIPALVRKALSADLLQWDDHATWHSERFVTEWRTEVPAFKDAVRASGQNRFEASGPGTLLRIDGEFTVDPGRIPGIPRLLASTLAPAIEKFLTGSIKANLLAVSKGVERYLDGQRS